MIVAVTVRVRVRMHTDTPLFILTPELRIIPP
jgi:hypothetical protein